MVNTPLANEAELKFMDWLERRRYPYLYVEQSPQTFSTFFREEELKRPDFLVILKHVGILAVEVKERMPTFDRFRERCFTLDEVNDVRRYINFESITRIPVWFVFLNSNDNYEVHYWIPLGKVSQLELKEGSSGEFRIIPLKECIAVQSSREGIYKILDY